MATTRADLSNAHRIAQARISAATFTAMASLWQLLDLTDLDRTAPQWLAASGLLVARSRPVSAAMASAYVGRLRVLDEVPGVAPLISLDPLPAQQVATALLVTGPVAVKAAIGRGVAAPAAARTGMARSAAAASRLTLSGGRDYVTTFVREDRHAFGYVRVTSPGACDFCQQIAEYSQTNPNLLGDFECHDNCHCQPEPIFG